MRTVETNCRSLDENLQPRIGLADGITYCLPGFHATGQNPVFASPGPWSGIQTLTSQIDNGIHP